MWTRALMWWKLKTGLTLVCCVCDWRKKVPFRWSYREIEEHMRDAHPSVCR